MKSLPPYGGGILHFFGGIRRSTLFRLPRGVGSHSEALVSTVGSTPRGEPSSGGPPFVFTHGLTAVVLCEGG